MKKIVHIATTDLGGSYKAVLRIHRELLESGFDSKVLLRTVFHKDSIPEGVIEIIDTPVKSLVSKSRNVFNLMLSKGEVITDRFGTDVSTHPLVKDADIILVHWANSFISYNGMMKLKALGKPVIQVAHDMWPSTGGCHLDEGCGRYSEGCGKCPLIGSGDPHDISARNFLLKKKAYEGVPYVGPSKWSADVARHSLIWEGHEIYTIYNPVDRTVFKPLDSSVVSGLRDKYGIPVDKKIILYGAIGGFREKNKGAQLLNEILSMLDSDEYHLVIFGNRPDDESAEYPIGVTHLGYIYDEKSLVEVYNSADVFLNLSKQESFCYTVCESLACGTPVVAFETGGVAEQVKTGVNGALAPYGDVKGIADGIKQVTANEIKQVIESGMDTYNVDKRKDLSLGLKGDFESWTDFINNISSDADRS